MPKVKCPHCREEHELSNTTFERLHEGKAIEQFLCPDCGEPIERIHLPPQFASGGPNDEDESS